ncbi:MAG TPA: hypothetical protein VFW47_14735 [Phenylobacterium sp.]|nr:hypothetical protein [Phenylobacterium sp.]
MTLAALAAGIALATTAATAPIPAELGKAFGNTVVSTYPDRRTALLWLKRDGTYDAKGRHRTPSSGTWTLKGDRVCLKQLKPVRAPFRYCTPLPSGSTWTAKAVTGERIRVRIVRGVVAS